MFNADNYMLPYPAKRGYTSLEWTCRRDTAGFSIEYGNVN